MATEVKDWDGDCLLESMRPLKEDSRLLNDRRAAVLHLEKRTAATSAKDELDAELKDLGGDCIKVMQLLKADSRLLKDRALAVLHLGVSRGCVEIVEQVVEFYEGENSLGDRSERGSEKDEQQNTKATEDGSNASSSNKGEDILGERSELDQQGVKSSREEGINAWSDNTDAPTVALDELQTQIDDKNENSDPDPSHTQDDPIRRTAAEERSNFYFFYFIETLLEDYGDNDEFVERPVLDFGQLLRAKYLYSGPARELDAIEVTVVNGNHDVLDLLVTKTPSASRSASRIGPKTRSVAMRDLHRNQLREITERVVERVRGQSVSLKIFQSVFDAWRDHPEFNFLFWDFGLGQERVSEYLFHFLSTQRNPEKAVLSLRIYLLQEVWKYQGEPWEEEPLWKSLLKLHDAQGRTPLHVAVDENTVRQFWQMLPALHFPDQLKVFAFAMEETDGLGRTPWHRAVLGPNEAISALDLSEEHKRLAKYCLWEQMDAPGIYDEKKNEVLYGRLWKQPMGNPMFPWRMGQPRKSTYARVRLDINRGISRSRRVSETTPLHSALLQGPSTMSQTQVISYGSRTFSPRDPRFRCLVEGVEASYMNEGDGASFLDALDLATLTSNVGAVKALLASAEQGPLKTAYTRHQSSEWGIKNRYGWVVGVRNENLPYPTIHIAAYFGNYDMLKVFIDSKICDPYIEDEEGHTVLHAILDPKKFRILGDVIDFANVKHIPPNYVGPPPYESTTVGRQGCINLLLQSGCDIFKVDKNGQAPYPKGSLSQDEKFLSWWYDRQLKEFTANQNAMSFATNAISVMATLVATASYVGPLQPPLGYSSGDGPNQIQAKYIWVRIFVVCDTLSFYLAIAAITFSLIPALPMPQQPMAAELQKTRGMIILAVATLFPSIVCILLAFAASSIIVISANGISSLGGNLTIITGSIGGVICLIGFLLLFIRLLGILFPRVRWVRKLYDSTSFSFEGKGITFPIVALVKKIRRTIRTACY